MCEIGAIRDPRGVREATGKHGMNSNINMLQQCPLFF
jgi:hypothetical protein